jgi:hypothetical protein
VAIAGCAQTPKQSGDTLAQDSAIRLIRDLSIKQTRETGGADRPLDAIFRPIIAAPIQGLRASGGVSAGDGFVSDIQSWCENPAIKRNLLQEATAEVQALCERRGGRQEGRFCKGANDPDEVIFSASVVRRSDGGGCERIQGAVIEPAGARNHPGYVAALRRVGYVTVSEAKALEDAEQVRQLAQSRKIEQLAAVERERHLAELPTMRKRGTTICRADPVSGNTSKGYVEDSTDEKIQIRVAEAFRTGAPNFKPGGFQPQVIWDIPARWRLC